MTTEPNISIESSGTEFSLKKKKGKGWVEGGEEEYILSRK